jgi:uncharacterized protein
MPENSTPKARRAATRPDPRSPYVLDVRSLGRRPGAMRTDRRSVPAPAGLGSEFAGVPQGALLALDVRLESVTEGVLVTATVDAPLHGQCSRCLDPITDEVLVDVVELFAWPDSATDVTSGEDEIGRIVDDHIDLEPAVRDAVVLGLPWTPLCRPDCSGLCPDCGQRLDELPEGHTHETLDPRWAALQGMVDGAVPNSQTKE